MATAILTLLADHCTADELSHMAAARRLAEHRPARLERASAEELAERLLEGDWSRGGVWVRPPLSWWRKHLPCPEPAAVPFPVSSLDTPTRAILRRALEVDS